jgi:hypothetical protein
MLRHIVLAGLIALALTTPARAGFLGNTVGATFNDPDLATVFANLGTAVVGPGIEFPNAAPFGAFGLDLSDTNIRIAVTDPTNLRFTFAANAFNGYVFTSVGGTIPAITGVSVNPETNLAGFTASRLTFDANHIMVNLSGLVFIGPLNTLPLSVVSIDVQFAPTAVPAPPTLLLGLVGVGCAGVARLRRFW